MIETFEDYPPQPYLDQVHDHCPLAAKTYCHIWRNRNQTNCFSVLKKDIWQEFLSHPTSIRSHLLSLCREGLISIDETPETINIELVSWDHE